MQTCFSRVFPEMMNNKIKRRQLLLNTITKQLWIKQNINTGLSVILTIVTKEYHDEHNENRDCLI